MLPNAVSRKPDYSGAAEISFIHRPTLVVGEDRLAGGNVYPLAAYALARSGKRDEARTELNKLLGLAETKPASAYNIALIYNALDESEKALDWLEKAYQARDTKMTLLKVEPKWNNLRNEPRFVDLMRRMKFAG
jgi:tetratricopeptide (TPR) repeat protein